MSGGVFRGSSGNIDGTLDDLTLYLGVHDNRIDRFWRIRRNFVSGVVELVASPANHNTGDFQQLLAVVLRGTEGQHQRRAFSFMREYFVASNNKDAIRYMDRVSAWL